MERTAVTASSRWRAARTASGAVQLVSEPTRDDAGMRWRFRNISSTSDPERSSSRILDVLARGRGARRLRSDRAGTLEAAGRIVVPALADVRVIIDIVGDGGVVERPLVEFADHSKAALADRLRSFADHPGWQTRGGA